MGKGILIVVLGVAVIIGFYILKLNANSKENLAVTVNMFEQTQARLIANSGVEVYLEKLKHNRSMMNNSYPNNSLFGGTYDVTISGVDSLVQVTSTATFMDAQHTTVVEAAADRVPLYFSPGALYLSSGTVASLKKNAINGNIEVNGNDHDLNGNLTGTGSVPGIGVDGYDQQQTILNMITKNTIDQVLGSGGTPSVQIVTNSIDWSEYAQLLADNPDIIIDSQAKIKTTNVWGTLTQPKVTFINGDIQLNNSTASSGCGILVVNGSLIVNGNFNFVGIVVAFKNTSIDITLNGNGSIIGSLVVAGNGINVDVSSGNFEILYSLQALNLIDELLATKRFSILSWWE